MGNNRFYQRGKDNNLHFIDNPDHAEMPGFRFHLFVLNRKQDISGVSGTGVVAQGVEFANGKVVLVWLTGLSSVAVYDSLAIMKQIHCHDGATEVLDVLPK